MQIKRVQQKVDTRLIDKLVTDGNVKFCDNIHTNKQKRQAIQINNKGSHINTNNGGRNYSMNDLRIHLSIKTNVFTLGLD
mmetsp:Transcript_12971/g.13911  ORF Transcript_12971/g.13911 Transcript_12971/m.13911 type:complete len:80 (-) Transcript_12971:46-285(-)